MQNAIGVKLTGDGQDLEKALQKAGKQVSDFGDSTARMLKSLGGAYIGGNVVQNIIEASDSMVIMNNRLKLSTGSSLFAGQAMESLFLIAQQSKVGFVELGNTFASVSRAGQDLGISQQRMLNVTQAIGQAMAISGGSTESMQAALVQLGQGLSSGVLRGEELNSVMEQSPRLAKAMADGLGVPLGELRKLGKEGKLTAEQVITALEKSAPQLAREIGDATVTVRQSFTVLGNAALKFVGDANAATGATQVLANGLLSVADGITTISKNAITLGAFKTATETIKVLWSDVAFVVNQTGIEIGAVAAQAAAVLRGDFSGAAAIRRELIADSEAARRALDLYQQRVLNPRPALPYVDDGAERTKFARQQLGVTLARKKGDPATAGVRGHVEEIDESRRALAQYVGTMDVATTKLNEFNQTQKAENFLLTLGKLGRVEQVRELVLGLAATSDAITLEKELQAIRQKAADLNTYQLTAIISENDALVENNEQQRLQLEELGLTSEAVDRLRLARMDANIVAEEEVLIGARNIEGNELQIQQLERRIALLKEARDIEGSKVTITEKDKEEKIFRQRSDRLAQGIEEGIYTGFKNSDRVTDVFINDLKAQFSKAVLRPVIKPVADLAARGIDGIVSGLAGLFSGFGFADGGVPPVGRASLVGESGPELFIPRELGTIVPNHQLGGGNVSRVMGGSTTIVNVIESPGNGGRQERRTENGVDIVDIFVSKVKDSVASEIRRGQGVVPDAMSATYGLNRVAGAY